MTATKLVPLESGVIRLETFDFRSEFAFDDFAEWIAKTLGAQPIGGVITEDMSPFDFVFQGTTFYAGWTDEHGCYVEGGLSSRPTLEAMQQALAG